MTRFSWNKFFHAFSGLALCVGLNTQGFALAPIKAERWTLDNKARVVFYRAPEVPMVDILIAFEAGSAYDGKQFGLSTLTSQLLDQGTPGMNATAIAERLAQFGAQFNSDNTRDMTVYHLKTLTEPKALLQSTQMVANILQKPSFPRDAFYRERNQLMMSIKQSNESPDTIANRALMENLYPNHPYGHPVDGTLKTVNELQNWQVQRFYKQQYTGEHTLVVIVGDLDAEKAHRISEELVGKLPAVGPHNITIPKALASNSKLTETIPFPSSQTMIRLGQVAVDHNDPEYFALTVGNYILGGGTMVSQLAKELREKRGLTYGVYSQFIPMPAEGPFTVSLSTKASQAEEALGLIQRLVKEFIEKGPSEDELTRAKQFLTGSFPLSLASNNNIANMLLRMEFYHLPQNYLDTYTAHIEGVSIDDIKSAFKHHLNPARMTVVTVGPK